MTFKLGGERRAAPAMAEIMARATDGLRADVVTFVPSSPASMAERGYNPAEALARPLARTLRVTCRPLLRKIRATADQAELGRDARRRNLSGAFAARGVGGAVLLVDDVMTTGATGDACARALRDAGAVDVVVVTFARAGSDGPG
jgi:predicted amidophosphoribosyltransferase